VILSYGDNRIDCLDLSERPLAAEPISWGRIRALFR
jgi:hypothetical protein